MPPHKNTIEGNRRKQNRRTNTNKAWGYQEQRKVCNTICMCGLSLAWVTSENSTMLLESDILRLFFTGPYLVSSPLCSVSGVDCPSVLPRQLLLFASLLSSRNSSLGSSHQLLLSCHQLPLSGSRRQLSFSGPATNCLSLVQSQLSPLSPATNCPFSSPATNCLSLGRVVNSRSRPLTTSGYGEISGPRILCLVSRQNRLVCFGGLPP